METCLKQGACELCPGFFQRSHSNLHRHFTLYVFIHEAINLLHYVKTQKTKTPQGINLIADWATI